eukprot:CAMPEP_0184749858 /NCGR_PEP_ID=MMETSP0315-20130426/31529_1 /TAXON_ID=101924 /ORGANISM="Rhodosorus marinus, Strain UTEX LB 2760" /LENGTH=35 /DNA_ID= /DNA_START= /DNA_END= /DNA_ORIENTATION=
MGSASDAHCLSVPFERSSSQALSHGVTIIGDLLLR